ncbi:MAG: AI-2E family transporter [Paracoccus denitrificans]|nr:MAG: AI-2E family transporter [Paracoccus denitrificans]PZO83517.1 MAG: AI-2E family transporter [Paracoccus denitrificans]
MRLSTNREAMWWGVAAIVLALALWRLGNVLTPFLIGAGVAYVMDPIADRLERLGLSRTMSVALITVVTLVLFVGVMLLIVPMLVRQVLQLIDVAPDAFHTVQQWLSQRFPQLFPADGQIPQQLQDLAGRVSEQVGKILPTVLSSLGNIIGVLLLLLIVPVVAFYLLLDWDHMVERVVDLLPREHRDTICEIGRQINESLSGFLRGQGLVTLILATFYSVGLVSVGLPFGLVIGIVAAVLSIIPYVGVFTGGVISMGVAAFTFWNEPVWIVAVAAIFVIGQLIEGNVLQPKIIGGHVGLHPVWLMIALAVFGTLFGFVGLVVAVPLGAILGVLARFFVGRYKESALYTGKEVPPEPSQPTLIELVPRGTVARTRASAIAARDRAVAEVKLEEAREEALDAAKAAAQKDKAVVATATVDVPPAGAHGAAMHAGADAEVRTWGGKTVDGTDPADKIKKD